MPTPTPSLRRPFILASVMAATFMIAIEATIVSTAMPQIAGQLGDLHLYAWVFSSFLLTQTATTVIFGKLADLYGRKPVLLAGIAIFLLGSLLCGLAWSMPSLIAFRLLQGVGAGGIQPICLTIIGDLYPAQRRAKVQGWLSSVWGISSVLGPLAGGLIIRDLSWSWIFWINLPVGIAAAAGFIAYLREDIVHQPHALDLPGAVLFTFTVAALMVALTEIGTGQYGIAAGAAALCGLGAALFALQERRATDPMLAVRLWTRRPIATANAASLLAGMTIVGLTAFLPMYVQGVLAQTAIVAGFALTMMVLGWPVGAVLAARHFPRFGLRAMLLAGAAMLPFGAAIFLLLTPGVFAGPVLAGAGSLVIGLGMGFLSTAAILIIQDSVGWAERGAATASNIFSRNLGSTLGATVLGAVLNLSLTRGPAPVAPDQIRRLLDRPDGTIAETAIRAALGHSLHLTFWAVFLIALATFFLSTLVPAITLRPVPPDPAPPDPAPPDPAPT